MGKKGETHRTGSALRQGEVRLLHLVMVSRHSSHSMTSCPPSRSLFHLKFAFLVAWREGYLAETNKRLVVTAAHSCATLTYPPSFVLLVTAVKVVMPHSPSLLRWMRSATSASPDEARKEWRRGGMMFLFISFNFFLHELWAWSKVSHWPLFSFNFFFSRPLQYV